MIPPFFENFGKRLIKSPKLYFVDSGLVCHLLGIESEKTLNKSPFLGPVFEGFVASEIIKQQIGSGRPKALYYFRDQQGLEVDFIVPSGNQQLLFVEAKASRTVTPAMADSMERLAGANTRYRIAKYLVHRESKEHFPTAALKTGVKALPASQLAFIMEDHPSGESARRGEKRRKGSSS